MWQARLLWHRHPQYRRCHRIPSTLQLLVQDLSLGILKYQRFRCLMHRQILCQCSRGLWHSRGMSIQWWYPIISHRQGLRRWTLIMGGQGNLSFHRCLSRIIRLWGFNGDQCNLDFQIKGWSTSRWTLVSRLGVNRQWLTQCSLEIVRRGDTWKLIADAGSTTRPSARCRCLLGR